MSEELTAFNLRNKGQEGELLGSAKRNANPKEKGKVETRETDSIVQKKKADRVNNRTAIKRVGEEELCHIRTGVVGTIVQ